MFGERAKQFFGGNSELLILAIYRKLEGNTVLVLLSAHLKRFNGLPFGIWKNDGHNNNNFF